VIAGVAVIARDRMTGFEALFRAFHLPRLTALTLVLSSCLVNLRIPANLP